MTGDILESVRSRLRGPIACQLRAIFGGREENTRAALRTGYSALLARLVHRSTEPGGIQEIYRLVTSRGVGRIFDNRGHLDPARVGGESVARSMLGNRFGAVAHAIAAVTRVDTSSATGLLAMAASMLLSVLEVHVTQDGLDARGLGTLLLRQRSVLQRMGLDARITSAMGFSSLSSMLGSAQEIRAVNAQPEPMKVPIAMYHRSWVSWAIAGAVAALAIVLLSTLSL